MPPPFSPSVDIKKLKTPPHSFLPAEQGNNLATSSLCVPCHRSLSLYFFTPHSGPVLHLPPRPAGAWSCCRAWRANPKHTFFPDRFLLPQRCAGTRLHLLQFDPLSLRSVGGYVSVCVVWTCRASTRADSWGGAGHLRLATARARDGEVNDRRRRLDPGLPWLDLPFPSRISVPPLLLALLVSPISPAAVDLVRTTSFRTHHAQDPEEDTGCGIQPVISW
jgi:hypothetical protein